MKYIGRFAPSPTGLLHIGSLLTAVASYLDAKAAGGLWLVRIEDLDPQREMAGAADHILRQLTAFGLEWDGEVWYQSQRHAAYETALTQLLAQDDCYPCDCSRKFWQSRAQTGIDGFIYDGHCSMKHERLQVASVPAWRFRAPDVMLNFNDRIVGQYGHNPKRDIGDFILKRSDGLWAYQLAVVVDDAAQGVTHVVRGKDLLVSTPRQIALQQALKLPLPEYAHLPLLLNEQGQKWSKQTLAPAINARNAENLLREVFRYLGLPTAPAVSHHQDLLRWAVGVWDMNGVPNEDIKTP